MKHLPSLTIVKVKPLNTLQKSPGATLHREKLMHLQNYRILINYFFSSFILLYEFTICCSFSLSYTHSCPFEIRLFCMGSIHSFQLSPITLFQLFLAPMSYILTLARLFTDARPFMTVFVNTYPAPSIDSIVVRLVNIKWRCIDVNIIKQTENIPDNNPITRTLRSRMWIPWFV